MQSVHVIVQRFFDVIQMNILNEFYILFYRTGPYRFQYERPAWPSIIYFKKRTSPKKPQNNNDDIRYLFENS